MCVYIRRTGRLPAAPAAQHNPQQQLHTQTARMARYHAGPALFTQHQQRAHERRVSECARGARRAAVAGGAPGEGAAATTPGGGAARGGGGGVCVRGKRGGCERSTHYLREQSVSHYLREQSAHYLRRPPCGGSWRDAWRRRGSNRSGRRGSAGVCGGGVCARWGRSACERSAASKGSQWRGFGRARAALTLAAQSPVATGRVPCPRNPVLEAARVSSAPVRVFLQTSEIP